MDGEVIAVVRDPDDLLADLISMAQEHGVTRWPIVRLLEDGEDAEDNEDNGLSAFANAI